MQQSGGFIVQNIKQGAFDLNTHINEQKTNGKKKQMGKKLFI
jgi:hypothetical protein